MGKKEAKWRKFEKDLLSFLAKGLLFDDCDGGPSNKIGGYQVDVSGGCQKEKIFFIIECTSKEEIDRKGSLKNKLKDFIAEQRDIKRGIKKRHGKKYTTIKFILALEDFEAISNKDLTIARKNNIYIWDSKYHETYRALAKILGPELKYYIFYELGITPLYIADGKPMHYENMAFKINHGNTNLYSFFMPANEMLKLAYVFRIESGIKKAYQRIVSEGKIKKIAEHIDGGNYFKNNIIVGINQKVLKHKQHLSPNKLYFKPINLVPQKGGLIQLGIVSIPKIYTSLWIIDGQHRLYGFSRAKDKFKNMPIPIMAIEDITENEQANTFIDINANQKPVDTNILWTLRSQIVNVPNQEQIISNIAVELNKDCPVLRNKIYIPGISHLSRKRYKLFIANFCKTLTDNHIFATKGQTTYFKLFKKDFTKEEKIARGIRLLSSFLKIIDRWLEEENLCVWIKNFFLSNNGFSVLMKILREALKISSNKKSFDDHIKKIKEPLVSWCKKNIEEIDKIRQRTSSESMREQEAIPIFVDINKIENDYAKDIIKKKHLEISDEKKILSQLEIALRGLIKKRLCAISKEWWKQRVPGEILALAEKNRDRNENPFPWSTNKDRDITDWFDFTSYRQIIERRDNWEEAFKEIFKDKELFMPKLREIEKIRVEIAHNREVDSINKNALKLYHEQINTTINKFIN